MRVIAGQLGGRRLVAPPGMATRPTSDRVREALFSALGSVAGAAVLDLFAGTGALGIEALSRGAARATFVESARPALLALRQNLTALELGACTQVLSAPVERAAATIGAKGSFDLIFADPPYAALGVVPDVIAQLRTKGAIGSEARIVVEHATRDAAPHLEGFAAQATRTYGDTSVTIYDADPA